jgi:hypothetical protein
MSFKNLPVLFTVLILMSLAGENLFAQVPATTQEKQLAQEVDSLRHEIESYNERLSGLESNIEDKADAGIIGFFLLLFGVFCALWAQNTGRKAWLWFWLGVCFNIITGIFLLSKNSKDRRLVAEGTKKDQGT